ncbi:thyroglobulin isoform X2 [Dunckerocampus dactyliophorus]|uniref:thyroglobulin isoform X2 n=1 Tax=Dunckerocampus dactyliophorus TaxID=161453 RepID=UPI00240554FE|nr:thyroglobulin isoform X2 [Dunckerocampus dactyliophorus]
MARLLSVLFILVFFFFSETLPAKPSGYQLDSHALTPCQALRGGANVPQCTQDGGFRPVQCSGQDQTCWCVDADGQEVPGTRTNGSIPQCATACQLQSTLRCSPSGHFLPVQCDSSRGQCWCVDRDGMELYGTRQRGTPHRCPGSCEVRARQLLHATASPSPSLLPQCSEDGNFLPVQCKLINMTDRQELDLLHAFNTFPQAFATFTAFRKSFPLVSSYCFCSDSVGHEMANTGVELLLSNVYDSAFSGPNLAHSFSESNVYKVLHRRTLGVLLAISGRFRCPSPCEEERRAATEASNVLVPSCEEGGAFASKQCQQGQCWCVDPTGAELPGTRQHGDILFCGLSVTNDCRSQRRAALARLFTGPLEPRLPVSSGGQAASCRALLRPIRDLLPSEAEPTSFLSVMVEVLHGLFPSVDGALEALARSSPRRFQENLFGGKFLKNAANFNLTGAVGTQGVVRLDPPSSLHKHQNLVRSVSKALEDPAFLSGLHHILKAVSSSGSASLRQVLTPMMASCSTESKHNTASILVPSCTPNGSFQDVQCQGSECWCVTSQGEEITGSRVVSARPRCPSRCERARTAALTLKEKMAAGAVVQIPECSEDGDFLPLQCVGSRCFCVDHQGAPASAVSAGGVVTCPNTRPQKPPSSSGQCARALEAVSAFRQEVTNIIAVSNSSHIPVGYGFLLSEGLRLTAKELQVGQSEEVLRVADWLMSHSKAALRLAAYSTIQMLLPSGRRTYQMFSPQCDTDGGWLPTQCYSSTGQCWCVDEDGEYVPDSLSSRSLPLVKCLTRCQRTQTHSLLSGWTKGSDVNASMSWNRPQCDKDGRFSVLQNEGTTGWCVNPQSGETIQTATRTPDGQLTCPSWCELQGHQCRPDGTFVPLQCDVTSCWCVSNDGQEVEGTRKLRRTGRTPSCDRPACANFTITHGTLVCRPAQDGRQSCDLVCQRGYHNSLPVQSFTCEMAGRQWEGDNKPLPGACQISQPVQKLSMSQQWTMSMSCSELQTLRSLLFNNMTSRGLCSAQLPASGRQVSLCDDSSVRVHCDGKGALMVTITWTALLSDLLAPDLPDLHDTASRLLEDFKQMVAHVDFMSQPILLSVTTPTLGCSRGYRMSNGGDGCVVCPAGSYSTKSACLLCPEGTYQDREGQDFCNKCPKGSSAAGSLSVNQCVTDCERRGLRCSDRGNFLPAQPDFLSGRWTCFNREGAELDWTKSDTPLTDEDCSELSKFQVVPKSEVVFGAEDAEILQRITSDLKTCAQACAVDTSCHHVALSNSQCQLYSTHPLNTHCNTSTKVSSFLGNPQAELFDWLRCFPRVRGVASNALVIRKSGAESTTGFTRIAMAKVVSGVFRTQVFADTSLEEARRFCEVGCRNEACCGGFILNQNSLSGGSVLCGWLRDPSILMCGWRDWDVTGQGAANRICGVGLVYNEQQRSFLFDFGGQNLTITESALPVDSKDKKDYQASIVTFQAIYLKTESAAASCGLVADLTQPLDGSVQGKFVSLSEDDVLVDPQRKLPALSFWINKNQYTSQQALLWCLTRCNDEPRCSVADLRDADSAGFFSCVLFADTRVCGAYDTPLRRPCRPLLDRRPNNTHSKMVDLSGPVKSFYQRISFQKMVSYSVRSRVTMKDTTPLTEGFKACERRCDEDTCCRGFGFIKDGSTGVVCVSLISLGVQTCGEDHKTNWRTQDCRPSVVQTTPDPFGWYQKPVNQWTSCPALCPAFSLPTFPNVSMDKWSLLADSAVLLDPSFPSFDIIHISRDIAVNPVQTRDWCLHACREAESCAAVTVARTDSATRCILYPDTTVCGLSSTPDSASTAYSCRLVIREPSPEVYLRRALSPPVTTVAIPGHGSLQGVTVETAFGPNRKTVIQFLGVPYARPPIGALRFEDAQPPDWAGAWDATKLRPTCVQPGDLDTSEDCLYLNIFRPVAMRGHVPVLVFFFNPSANQSRGMLDGSTLAAIGNFIVVTASYRTAALGFLSTGSSGLRGNYGLSDQEAVLQWVNAHIHLVGGDKSRVTVGAERGGADIISLHLLSPMPLFQRMLLMGGSIFSPSSVQMPSAARGQAFRLAKEVNCVTSEPAGSDDEMVACLRATPVHVLNAAQTKLLATSGPFQSWSPTRHTAFPLSLHRVDLLLGTSEHDGLISRAQRIKDFEALQGRADGKTAFYEALSRSLGGAKDSELLKEAAAWFYSLDHSPNPAGYNLFSRALDNATRDLFIICPTLRMATHFANSNANVFLYHQPAASTHSRADVLVPLDVQLVFGAPHQPISWQRFTLGERRLSLAAMSYVSSFVKTGNPNPSQLWSASALPRWDPVLSSAAPATFLELSPALSQQRGPREKSCSFWNNLAGRLTSGAETTLMPELPLDAPSSQSQAKKDTYS